MNSDETRSLPPQRNTGKSRREKLGRTETAKPITICFWQFAYHFKSLTDGGKAAVYFQIRSQLTLAPGLDLYYRSYLDKASLHLLIKNVTVRKYINKRATPKVAKSGNWQN